MTASLGSDGRIEVRSRFDDRITQFAKSLGAVFDGRRNAWIVDALPQKAHRLVCLTLEGVHVEVAPPVREIARKLLDTESLDFETQPPLRVANSWRHQLGWYDFSSKHHGALAAMGMGTGKSKPSVDRIVNAGWRTTLILCPSSVLGVWRRELDKWAGAPLQVLVLDKQSWNVKRQAEEAEKFLRLCEANNQRAVIVQNYESATYHRKGHKSFRDWSLARQWDCVICDEAHRLGGATSKTSQYAGKLGRQAEWRMALTGTPLSHSPLSIFGIARFLDPSYFGSSWPAFRGQYAVIGKFGADHVVGYKNLDELSLIMSRFTYQVGSEVLDLPPELHEDIEVTLSPEALRVYGELETDMITNVNDEWVTCPNALVKLLRLQQITSGHLPLEDGTIECLGHEKEDALAALLETIATRDPNNPDGPSVDPVVVCCVFKEDLARIRAVAERLGLRYGEVSGAHCDLNAHAQMFPETDVLGVQIRSGGVGIDLTRARYAVLLSVGYSLSNYDQFLARIRRPGQTRPVTYYHLVARKTVDETIYKALGKRRNLIEAVLARLRGHE